jgi:hypothetical protein
MASSLVSATVDPQNGPAGRSGRLSLPIAFGAITAIFVLFAAAASAPSPLYVVYQEEWGFSATTLTIIFAVYVLGLIGSLLILGALSDHVGRRPFLPGRSRWKRWRSSCSSSPVMSRSFSSPALRRASPPARRCRRSERPLST